MSDYNNSFSFDRISAKDIAEEIQKELAPYYPDGDEKALILAAINFYEVKDAVDSYGDAETNFDKVELLIPEIKKNEIEFKKLDNAVEIELPVQKTLQHKSGSLRTTNEPLVTLYAEYIAMLELKDEDLLPLMADFEDIYVEIEGFIPTVINYSKENKKQKIEFVKNGLQNDPAACRNAFVNDTFKLLDKKKKLDYQFENFESWTETLGALKEIYYTIKETESMMKDCLEKINRLNKLVH